MKRQGKLSFNKQKGRYQRTLGQYRNAHGKIVPKKFLLLADHDASVVAVARLIVLWDEIEGKVAHQNRMAEAAWRRKAGVDRVSAPPAARPICYTPSTRSRFTAPPFGTATDSRPGTLSWSMATPPKPEPRQPLWDDQTLAVARQIIKSSPKLLLPPAPKESEPWIESMPLGPTDTWDHAFRDVVENPLAEPYPEQVARFRRVLDDMAIEPADQESYESERQAKAEFVSKVSSMADSLASAADLDAPAMVKGTTLHAALEKFAERSYEEHHNPNARTKNRDYGDRKRRDVRSLLEAHSDIPVAAIDLKVIRGLCEFYKRRPKARNTGKPIAVDTVRHRLKLIAEFFRWLEIDDGQWRIPRGAEREWRFDRRRLMTPKERAATVNRRMVFTQDELTTLFDAASDRIRMLMVLALNCGFAQAEWCSLQWAEVKRDTEGTYIRRLRGKSFVYGEFYLWPESVRVLEWCKKTYPPLPRAQHDFVLLTEAGNPMSEQSIANMWKALLDQITKHQPEFPRLSFKHLRKTYAQMIRDLTDGETAGVLLCHGRPVESDALSESYSKPTFERCHIALGRVREQLLPILSRHFPNPISEGGDR